MNKFNTLTANKSITLSDLPAMGFKSLSTAQVDRFAISNNDYIVEDGDYLGVYSNDMGGDSKTYILSLENLQFRVIVTGNRARVRLISFKVSEGDWEHPFFIDRLQGLTHSGLRNFVYLCKNLVGKSMPLYIGMLKELNELEVLSKFRAVRYVTNMLKFEEREVSARTKMTRRIYEPSPQLIYLLTETDSIRENNNYEGLEAPYDFSRTTNNFLKAQTNLDNFPVLSECGIEVRDYFWELVSESGKKSWLVPHRTSLPFDVFITGLTKEELIEISKDLMAAGYDKSILIFQGFMSNINLLAYTSNLKGILAKHGITYKELTVKWNASSDDTIANPFTPSRQRGEYIITVQK